MKDHGGAPAKHPCGTCPYRQDVPSGVWARSEYEKLPQFDGPIETQPHRAFFCHQQDGRLCAGWVGCHDMDQSLGLRLAASFRTITLEAQEAALDYVSPVPLWASGQEAHDYGVAGIDDPDEEARRKVHVLTRRLGGKLQYSDGTPVVDDPERLRG